MKIKKKTKLCGFTLIELLVVVAIIGIISSIGIVSYNGYTKSAKISVTKTNHKLIQNATLGRIVSLWRPCRPRVGLARRGEGAWRLAADQHF